MFSCTCEFYFKGKQTKISEIAKELGVAHVLEGSVRKSGNKLRVTAQLVRVDNGYHVWSETYDRSLDDIFKIQDDIAGAVVKSLKVSLLQGTTPREAPTSSTEAYTLYLQARKISEGGMLADYSRASDYLQQALKLDPKFARAWAAVAQIRMESYGYGEETSGYKEVRADALEAAARALKLDPNLSDAHLAMAWFFLGFDWDWHAAELALKRAIELDPGNSEAFRLASIEASALGRLDDALQFGESAVMLDPLAAENYSTLGYAHFVRGRLKDAESAYRKAVELNNVGAEYHFDLGVILLAEGQATAALAVMQQEPSPEWRQLGLTLAFDALGRSIDADRELAAFEKAYAANWAYSIVQAHAARRDVDQAFAWLDRAYRQHDVGLTQMKTDPLLKNLTPDPRYNAFLRKMKLAE